MVQDTQIGDQGLIGAIQDRRLNEKAIDQNQSTFIHTLRDSIVNIEAAPVKQDWNSIISPAIASENSAMSDSLIPRQRSKNHRTMSKLSRVSQTFSSLFGKPSTQGENNSCQSNQGNSRSNSRSQTSAFVQLPLIIVNKKTHEKRFKG